MQPDYMPTQPSASHQQQTPIKPPQKKPHRDGLRSILSTLAILIAAPLVAILLTNFVFQSYEVDGPSMQPTLQNKDRLIVVKLQHTIGRITGKEYVPDRGDVIVFSATTARDSATTDNKRHLIKRVIGLPGDRVVVKDGAITIYNNEYPEGFNPDKTLPYGDSIDETSGDVDIVVGKEEVFVCGDNRANSYDSRELGTIPAKDITGKLALRMFPLSEAKVF